ncbi:MAG: hypothetical protein Q9220_007515 [cf. Caloplaca sp. 1 TL-2023]
MRREASIANAGSQRAAEWKVHSGKVCMAMDIINRNFRSLVDFYERALALEYQSFRHDLAFGAPTAAILQWCCWHDHMYDVQIDAAIRFQTAEFLRTTGDTLKHVAFWLAKPGYRTRDLQDAIDALVTLQRSVDKNAPRSSWLRAGLGYTSTERQRKLLQKVSDKVRAYEKGAEEYDAFRRHFKHQVQSAEQTLGNRSALILSNDGLLPNLRALSGRSDQNPGNSALKTNIMWLCDDPDKRVSSARELYVVCILADHGLALFHRDNDPLNRPQRSLMVARKAMIREWGKAMGVSLQKFIGTIMDTHQKAYERL